MTFKMFDFFSLWVDHLLTRIKLTTKIIKYSKKKKEEQMIKWFTFMYDITWIKFYMLWKYKQQCILQQWHASQFLFVSHAVFHMSLSFVSHAMFLPFVSHVSHFIHMQSFYMSCVFQHCDDFHILFWPNLTSLHLKHN